MVVRLRLFSSLVCLGIHHPVLIRNAVAFQSESERHSSGSMQLYGIGWAGGLLVWPGGALRSGSEHAREVCCSRMSFPWGGKPLTTRFGLALGYDGGDQGLSLGGGNG